MKVCVYGAGAIGGWIGVKLAQAGCDVSVVARGATLEALLTEALDRLTRAIEQSYGLAEAPYPDHADGDSDLGEPGDS